MYNLFINRSTYRSRKWIPVLIGKTFESGNSTIISNELFSHLVQFSCRNSRSDDFGQFTQSLPYQSVTLTEQLYLIFGLKKYHLPI